MSIKRLEAVIVCRDYSDFLSETLPWNMRQFDRVIVVTSPDDMETKNLCAHLSVECRETDLFDWEKNEEATACDTLGVKKENRPGRNKFCKSRGIDYGLAYLHRDDWVVHLDADVWLPPMFRNWFNWMQPDKDCIYGMDRFNCVGFDKWKGFLSKHPKEAEFHQHIRHCLVIPPTDMPMGARISIKEYGGYVPIGFFQAWHAGSTNRRYPHNQGSAEHTDVLHSIQWPARSRRHIPEMFALHLESLKLGNMGRNWNGRVSQQFGPFDPFGIRKPGYLQPQAIQERNGIKTGSGQTAAVGRHHHHPDYPPINITVQPAPVNPTPLQVNVAAPNVQIANKCECCCEYGYGDGFGPTPITPCITED